MRVQVRRLALDDLQSAVAWYSERDEDVAADFLAEVAHVIARISERPEQFPVVHRGARRALLKQFPFAIYFRVHDTVLTVIAIMRQRRSTSRWKTRL